MTTTDLLEETYIALSANKARSLLTILGIVIGISSVIAMIAIGQGAQGAVQSRIQEIGSNLILIQPGAQRGPGTQVSAGRGSAQSLTQADADAIAADVPGVAAVAPDVSTREQIVARGTNTNTSVMGVTPDYLTVRNVQIDQGSFISQQNVQGISKIAVLGPTARDDLFGADANAIGQQIRIKGVTFTVIGITVAKGGTGFGSQDNIVYVPLTSAQRFLIGNNYVSTINVQATDASVMTQAQQDITNLLLARHNISDPARADFNVLNQADILATASSVTQTFTILLAAVAGISLLVGGIGIMNMMLTTVTERTKEIGLRKAIGAKRRDISIQFLIEAVMLTFIGGAIGVILGWLIAYAFSAFGIIAAEVSVESVALAFGVSAGIGIVFGYYPAQRAAKLNPIQALRYE